MRTLAESQPLLTSNNELAINVNGDSGPMGEHAPLASKVARLTSIDLLRGVIMIIMVIQAAPMPHSQPGRLFLSRASATRQRPACLERESRPFIASEWRPLGTRNRKRRPSLVAGGLWRHAGRLPCGLCPLCVVRLQHLAILHLRLVLAAAAM